MKCIISIKDQNQKLFTACLLIQYGWTNSRWGMNHTAWWKLDFNNCADSWHEGVKGLENGDQEIPLKFQHETFGAMKIFHFFGWRFYWKCTGNVYQKSVYQSAQVLYEKYSVQVFDSSEFHSVNSSKFEFRNFNHTIRFFITKES